MRILLASSASHVPPRGGATRSNLAWLDALASHGHTCRIVAGALTAATPEKVAEIRRETEDQDAGRTAHDVYAVADPVKRAAALKEQIRDFQPDWLLVSSEDSGQALLRAAHEAAPGRVVYLAHTPQFYPFGPASWSPDREGAELVANSSAIIAIGHHTADYIGTHLRRPAEVIHPPVYGLEPLRAYRFFFRWPKSFRSDASPPCRVGEQPRMTGVPSMRVRMSRSSATASISTKC